MALYCVLSDVVVVVVAGTRAVLMLMMVVLRMGFTLPVDVLRITYLG